MLTDQERQHALVHCAYNASCERQMEQPLLQRNVPLMRMAANAAADTILETVRKEGWDLDTLRVTVLAGGGDNGGDGLYTGAILAQNGLDVTAIAVSPNLHEQAFSAFLHAGGHIWALDPASRIPGCPSGFSAGEAGKRLESAIAFAKKSDIIIDAMTGIGLKGALRGIPATMARALGADGTIPERLALPDHELELVPPFVVAIDTPSGIGVDDGTLPGPYIPADLTVTFGAQKPCVMLPPAAFACGRVTLVDFQFDFSPMLPTVESVTAGFAREALNTPLVTDSKYSRGVLGLITGSQQYPGAAVMSTCAAARTNIGMVRYMGPDRPSQMVLDALPEAVLGKGHVQAWTVGSGVGDLTSENAEEAQHGTIRALLRHYALSQADHVLEMDDSEHPHTPSAFTDEHYVMNDMERDSELEKAKDADALAYEMPPVVVDAGALDLLPNHVPAHVVLTPHAGELARLLSRIDATVTTQDILENPLHYATRAAELTGATVLLKGAITIVVGPDGDGALRTLVSGRAPAFLATAGAGDVLAGMVGALLAQHAEDIEDDPAIVPEIVASAAYIHGYAAALAACTDQKGWSCPRIYGKKYPEHEPGSMGHPILAMDVVKAIPDAIDALQM